MKTIVDYILDKDDAFWDQCMQRWAKMYWFSNTDCVWVEVSSKVMQ